MAIKLLAFSFKTNGLFPFQRKKVIYIFTSVGDPKTLQWPNFWSINRKFAINQLSNAWLNRNGQNEHKCIRLYLGTSLLPVFHTGLTLMGPSHGRGPSRGKGMSPGRLIFNLVTCGLRYVLHTTTQWHSHTKRASPRLVLQVDPLQQLQQQRNSRQRNIQYLWFLNSIWHDP